MRWLLAWAFYWAGDAACRITNIVPDKWEAIGMACARAYQSLMCTALRLQGDGPGPWEVIDNLEKQNDPH